MANLTTLCVVVFGPWIRDAGFRRCAESGCDARGLLIAVGLAPSLVDEHPERRVVLYRTTLARIAREPSAIAYREWWHWRRGARPSPQPPSIITDELRRHLLKAA